MQEINLYDLVKFYARNWLNFVIAVFIGAIIGLVYTNFIQTPMYESRATLLVVGTNRPSSNQDSVVLNNYVGLFQSKRVLGSVIDDQDYEGTYEQLASNTTAENRKNTDIIEVSISSKDAKTSQSLLQGAIESFRTQVQELYGDNTLTVKTVDQPGLATEPANVKPVVQTGLAVAASVLLLTIVMFFYYDYRQSSSRGASAQASSSRAKKPAKKTK